jgi:dTDP-4-dehydrorhamnose reductase
VKVVVTGASSFLGSYVLAELVRREHMAVGWCRRPAPCCTVVDFSETHSAAAALENADADAVINLAAISDIKTCKEDPDRARQVNSSMAGELSRLAALHHFRLVHVSTDQIFDGSRGGWREADAPRPLHLYGETKLTGEKEIEKGIHQAVIIRPSLCTGVAPPGRRSSTSWLLDTLKNGEQPKLFTDEIRSPVAASDVARVLADMVEMREVSGLFHCGGDEVMTRYELACREALVAGFDAGNLIPSTREEVGLAAERPADLSLDSSRLIDILGWTPRA